MNESSNRMHVTCPHCRAVFGTERERAGGRIICPECGSPLTPDAVSYPSGGFSLPQFFKTHPVWLGIAVVAVLCVIFKLLTGSPKAEKRTVDECRMELMEELNKELNDPASDVRTAFDSRIVAAHLTVTVKSARVVRIDIETVDGNDWVGKDEENIRTLVMLLRFEWEGFFDKGYTDLKIDYDVVNERMEAKIDYTTAFLNTEDPELWIDLGFLIGSCL